MDRRGLPFIFPFLLFSGATAQYGFGLFWHGPRYYLGASIPMLLENDINAVAEAGIVTATEARHWFLLGGYVLDIDRSVKFKPSFMLRAVQGAPLSLGVNANFLFRERIWLGAMYRLDNAFGVLGQYQVNDQFRVGYAFDLTTTKIGAYNAGTHEIMLAITIGKDPPAKPASEATTP